jgi:2-hydroxy-3-oxopropionate reductase
MANIGFIGLGIMGAPMAGHLVKDGHTLFTNTVGPTPSALVDAGACVCLNGAEVAAQADIVFIMVPDTPQVDEVLFGKDGVASALRAGKIVVDMSSISPVATKDFAHRINALGCDYLDAPVSGGEVGAKAASLTIMVGGSAAAFTKVKPLFEKMGKNITLVGGNGDGQITKVANQIIVALTTGRQLGVALPNTATAQELFNTCAAHDGGGWDHSAMVRALEIMANFEIGQKQG